jgi:FKBP-type peptidyl-prolyl cis-trans isomerase (trigger factor)
MSADATAGPHGAERSEAERSEAESVALDHVTAELADEAKDQHSRPEVEQAINEAAKRYEDAPVRDFVPILVEREAREILNEP